MKTEIATTRHIKYSQGERSDDGSVDTLISVAFALDMQSIGKLKNLRDCIESALADVNNAITEYHKVNG